VIFPVSHRATTGNECDGHRFDRARIAVHNRRKQDENRKRAQPRLATRQFARHSDAFAAPAVCSRTISAGGVTRSNDERRCCVLAFHDVKQPAPAGRACGAGQRLRVAAPLTLHGTPPHRARIEHALSRLRTVVNSQIHVVAKNIRAGRGAVPSITRRRRGPARGGQGRGSIVLAPSITGERQPFCRQLGFPPWRGALRGSRRTRRSWRA